MLNADPASLASAQPLLASAQSVLSDVTTLQDKLDSLLGEVTGLEAQLTEGLQRARTLQEELTDALRHAGRTAMAAAGVKADDPEGQMEGLFATLFGARSELVASGPPWILLVVVLRPAQCVWELRGGWGEWCRARAWPFCVRENRTTTTATATKRSSSTPPLPLCLQCFLF